MAIALARRTVLLAALFLPAMAAAQAARTDAPAPRTYAVVSLIGDQFSVVSRRHSVGTRLDPNERRVFAMPDPVFDRIAGAAVERALLAAKPATPVLQAAIRDPRLFALQDKLLTESQESHDMRIALNDVLAKAGATHLLLVTKWRGEARFPVTTGMIGGGGPISGLGFYLDNETTMSNVERPNTGVGFLAPFAYVMVSLIELPAMRVLKSRQAPESWLWLPADKQGADRSWDALSAKEKVSALENLVQKAAQVGTYAVLAP